MEFTCAETQEGITVHIGPHQGSYGAWWSNLQIEVYGSPAAPRKVSIEGTTERVDPSFDPMRHTTTILIPDNGRGADLQIEWSR
jgi:alpha-glucosidase